MSDKEIKSVNGTKEKVLSGLFWTFGERILAQGVSFVLSIILARLLFPSEYGIIAMVMVFINIANELDAPVERVCGLNITSPFSPALEDLNYPHAEQIAEAVRKTLNV